MSDAITNAAFNRLSRTALHNPSASVRKAALLDIRKLDHEQVEDVLRQVIDGDSDAEVRDLAQNLLRKHEINSLLDEGRFDDLPEAAPPPSFNDLVQDDFATEDVSQWEYDLIERDQAAADDWTCRFCDTVNPSTMTECASCGATREVKVRRSISKPRVQGDDVFLLNKSNRKFLDQRSKRVFTSTLGSGCIMLFLLPFLVVGIVVIGLAIQGWQHYHILNTSGVIASGAYTGSRVDNDDDGTTYYTSYRFQSGDEVFSDEQSVDYEIYRRSEIGAPVEVVYAAGDPSISRIAGTNDLSEPVFFTFFAGFWNLISWGIFLGLFYSRRRDGLLAREGQLVNGEVLSVNTRKDSDGDLQVTVEYGFTRPDNLEYIRKKQSAQRNDLKRDPLPEPGTPVAVMYRNEKHYRML